MRAAVLLVALLASWSSPMGYPCLVLLRNAWRDSSISDENESPFVPAKTGIPAPVLAKAVKRGNERSFWPGARSASFSRLILCPSYARPMPLADPGEAQFHALFLCLVGGIGGADLLQHGGRQGADLLDKLLQVFALHRRSGELQLLDLIEEVLVLHRGVKGAAQRSEAIGRHAGCREECQPDIGRGHDRAQDLA